MPGGAPLRVYPPVSPYISLIAPLYLLMSRLHLLEALRSAPPHISPCLPSISPMSSLYLACISPYLLEALRSAKAFERQLESSAEQADVGEMQGRCRGDIWEVYGRSRASWRAAQCRHAAVGLG